jgi:heme-degrading monooxygenase HmoA
MWMRITWGKVRPGLWDSFEELYGRIADPNTEGLIGRQLARDTVDIDAFFAISVWATREAIDTWESSEQYRSRFLNPIDPFMLGAYSVSVCDIRYASAWPPLTKELPPGGTV